MSDKTEREEYEEFLDQLARLTPPIALSRWHNDVIMMFTNDFEDILYGEDE